MTTRSPHPFLAKSNDTRQHNHHVYPHDRPHNPRFSTGLISYRTDSPDSSLYLARVPQQPVSAESRRESPWNQSMNDSFEGALPSSIGHEGPFESQRDARSMSSKRSHRRSYISTETHSTMSSEPTHIYQAQLAHKASASSHNILPSRSSISSLIHAAANRISAGPSRRGQRETEQLNRELGALPWPELPPRAPSSRTGPPSTPGDVSSFPPPSPNFRIDTDRPSYSFLDSDPLPSGLPSRSNSTSQSRRSSRSSEIFTPLRSGGVQGDPLPLPPKDVPLSPTWSNWSGSGNLHQRDRRFSAFTMGAYTGEGMTVEGGERPASVWSGSGMADVDSSREAVTPGSTVSAKFGSYMGTMRSSREDKRASTKSGRSGKTRGTKSTKSSNKRMSTASSHYKVGKWEVDEGVPLVHRERDLAWRDVEEKMDLDRLLARSLVLERMLRKGKRVSAQSFKASLHRRFTASTKRSSLSPSLAATSPWPLPSTTPAARRSASIRYRLSRKLRRRASKEDVYSEIGSPALAEPERVGSTHGEIIVFAEHPNLDTFEEPKGPPTPPKPAAISRKLRPADIRIFAPSSCLPYRPTSTYDYTQHERSDPNSHFYVPHPSAALRGSYRGPFKHIGDVEKAETYRQSPHLGHRSPDWRRRRASLASFIETGHWDARTQKRWIWGVVIGGGIVLVVIVGLVSGLLSRRTR